MKKEDRNAGSAKNNRKAHKGKTGSGGRGRFIVLAVVLVTVMALAVGIALTRVPENPTFRAKTDLMKAEALTDHMYLEMGDAPAGDAGFAVFISVCDKTQRAEVYSATGDTAEAAWDKAVRTAEKGIHKSGTEPLWVKTDIVFLSELISASRLEEAVKAARHEFFRYGVAFDQDFDTALLEAEMNGAKIYDYDNGGIDLTYLNTYLKKANRPQLKELPLQYTVFQTFGWFCDEDNTVYSLNARKLDYGRRDIDTIDDAFAKELIVNGSDFLMRQVKEDGSFIYGYYPRFGNEIENYNIVRHASTIWSLLCRYRMEPDEELKECIQKTISYLLKYVIYNGEDTAYLYEEKDDEIKLGGCGVAVIALTEYMDVFGNKDYADVCEKLGNGILTMFDSDTGSYYHVLNGDFSRKEEFRTVYYDGEATFALSRLYALTGDQKWLDAAETAVDHFIAEDYAQYKDHWIAYTMNEITKYVTDKPEYYAFALKNAQDNLDEIRDRDTTYHTYLELLMSTFEVYDRLKERGAEVSGFDEEKFLNTIYTRANRMLNGYFFPEYAMYMAKPDQILDTFMVRHDGYRVRIDDVQHNIGGFYLYYKNYDRLVECGLLEQR